MTSEYQTEIETAWLEAILNKQLSDNSLCEIVTVNVTSGVPKGQNYASQIYRIKIELILGSGKKTKKSFIFKKLPQGEGISKVVEEFSVFKKETKIYCDILPYFDAIMNEFEDPNDKLWCSYIGHKPYTEILLEDLKPQNFTVSNRQDCMGVKHGLLVMNSLGRFHGMSHVLLQKGVLNRNDLSKHSIEMNLALSIQIAPGGFRTLAEVMENYWPSEWKPFAPRIAKLADVTRDKVVEVVTDIPKDAFFVLCHGDCWTCNVMFKYCPYDEETPIAMRFVDFQGSFYNVYILDILNFLCVSISGEDRQQNMDLFLHEYHKSLVATLTFYGIPDVAPSIDHVYAELKRAKFLLVMYVLLYYAARISELDAPIDFNKLETGGDSKEVFNPEIFKSEKYRLAVGPDIRQWMDEGLL